jgi:CRISPR-associated protein Cpf1
MLKYFLTKENKRKGSPQDSEIENLLKKLVIDVDWFKNYDAVRNYLTKKPQSEINKLKLNFENGSLLGGWSDGQEKLKGAVLLKNNDKFYVGIL